VLLNLENVREESMSSFQLEGHTLSPIDSVALIAMRPPETAQKGQILDPSRTLIMMPWWFFHHRQPHASNCIAARSRVSA
jgi:hypothetical protein